MGVDGQNDSHPSKYKNHVFKYILIKYTVVYSSNISSRGPAASVGLMYGARWVIWSRVAVIPSEKGK